MVRCADDDRKLRYTVATRARAAPVMVTITDGKYDIAVLAKRLEQSRTEAEDGNVSFSSFDFHDIHAVLGSSLVLDNGIPRYEQQGIIQSAMFAAGKAGTITKASLLREVSTAECAYMRQPVRPFVVATSLSFKWFSKLRRTSVDGNAVTFSSTLPARFRFESIRDRIQKYCPNAEYRHFVATRVHVESRTPFAAVYKALDSLDLLRGHLNLAINRATSSRMTFGERPPVNQVRLGPIHTVHETSGRLATEAFWHEPVHQCSSHLAKLDRKWESLRDIIKGIRTRLRRIPYADELRPAFLRYARALDPLDYEVAFTKLWGVLEYLTHTVGGRYSETISRSVFLFQNREFNRIVLEHLRDARNRVVHHDEKSEQEEVLLFQLKRYVEAVFFFHLNVGQMFMSLADAAAFLELPADKAILRAHIARYRRAIRFLR